jgi:hypothetical protein
MHPTVSVSGGSDRLQDAGDWLGGNRALPEDRVATPPVPWFEGVHHGSESSVVPALGIAWVLAGVDGRIGGTPKMRMQLHTSVLAKFVGFRTVAIAVAATLPGCVGSVLTSGSDTVPQHWASCF